jgi:hypothetical protein
MIEVGMKMPDGVEEARRARGIRMQLQVGRAERHFK